MSKEAYYFSHDANARHDPKILAMRSEFGIEGYGVYWVIVEMLRESEEYILPKKDYIFNAIAMQVQSNAYTKDDAKRFVEKCINDFDLFDENEHHFWSNSLLKRMNKKDELSEKRKAAAKARWEKVNNTNGFEKNDDASAMQNDANAMQTDAIKGNEKKGNEIKRNKKEKEQYAEFVTLTTTEYETLVEKHGKENVMKMIDVLDNYKGANGKKYASDYRAILNWVVDRVVGKKEMAKVGAASQKSKFDGVKIEDE